MIDDLHMDPKLAFMGSWGDFHSIAMDEKW